MSEGISAPFIRYPIGTSLMMAGILFVGIVAYPLLPVAPLPQVDFPTIQVSASPARRQSGNDGLVRRTAAGEPARADSRRRADDVDQRPRQRRDHDPVRSRPPIDAAAQDVQSAISAATGQLPTNLPSPPTYRKVNPADSPIMLLSATSDVLPLTEVSDAVDAHLAQQISQLRGSRRSSSSASRSRPSACRSTRPSSPRWACRSRTCAA